MPRKRPNISFPELEGRGRRAILRSAEEIRAEERQLQEMLSKKPEADRPTLRKVTYRFAPEAVEAVHDMKRILRREYGIRVNLEEIVERAVLHAYQDLQENQKASFLANQLSGKQENQQS